MNFLISTIVIFIISPYEVIYVQMNLLDVRNHYIISPNKSGKIKQ